MFFTANYAKENNLTSMEGEREMFGITHEDTGKWIAEKWQLPAQLVSAISQHHNPEKSEDQEIRIATSLVHLSDMVCNLKLLSFGTEYIRVIPKDEISWEILKKVSPNSPLLIIE